MELSIIERVKKIREDKKMSQKEFSEALGVSLGYIGGVETGRNPINHTFLTSLKEKYNISADWLLFGEYTTTDSLNIDILKLVVALDNSNRFLLFYINETLQKLEESTKQEDKKNLEVFMSGEFKILHEKIVKLDADKNKLYTSILEDAVIGDKTNFDLTEKIKRYSEINLELNNVTNTYFGEIKSLKLIDLSPINQLLNAK